MKSSDIQASNLTCPSVDDVYDQLSQTLSEYEIIVRRWPEYAVVLESVSAAYQSSTLSYHLWSFIECLHNVSFYNFSCSSSLLFVNIYSHHSFEFSVFFSFFVNNFLRFFVQVLADVQNAVVEALEKQYADVLSPLKDNLTNLGLKYVQKFAKRTDGFYSVPEEVSDMKSVLDYVRM